MKEELKQKLLKEISKANKQVIKETGAFKYDFVFDICKEIVKKVIK